MVELSKQSKLHEVHMHKRIQKMDDKDQVEEAVLRERSYHTKDWGDHEDIQVRGQAGTSIAIKITNLIPAPVLNRGIIY